MKDWAVLAYLVGDHKGNADSLDEAISSELKAISDAADRAGISVAVQVDFRRKGKTIRATLIEHSANAAPAANGRPGDDPLSRQIIDQLAWQKRHRLLSAAGQLFQAIGKKLRTAVLSLMRLPDLNAAGKEVLQDFLRFGRKKCPAKRYLIYFFGHAFGPMGLFFDSETRRRPPNSLRLNDLADAIEGSEGRASIVLFRDCFMCTLETAFQLRSCADFVLASQAEAPIAGVWPWDQFMSALVANKPSADIGKEIGKRLTDFLKQDGNRRPFADVPYSLLDLSVAPRLVEPLKRLVHALEDARTDKSRHKACSAALEAGRIGFPDDHQTPGDPALIDVPTICARLQALSPDPVAEHATRLAALLPSLVPFNFTLLGQHKGVSLYYKPTTERDLDRSFIQSTDPPEEKRDAANYVRLALCKASEWGRFAIDPLS